MSTLGFLSCGVACRNASCGVYLGTFLDSTWIPELWCGVPQCRLGVYLGTFLDNSSNPFFSWAGDRQCIGWSERHLYSSSAAGLSGSMAHEGQRLPVNDILLRAEGCWRRREGGGTSSEKTLENAVACDDILSVCSAPFTVACLKASSVLMATRWNVRLLARVSTNS